MPLHDRLRTGRRQVRQEHSKRPAVIAGIVLVALLASALALWMKGNEVRVVTDVRTLCPQDRALSGITVVLLDVSDDFSEAQRLEIENHLQRVSNGLPRFNLLEVYVVERESQQIATPVIHLCSPGTGEDLNEWYQNPTMARRKWGEFSTKLTSEIERILLAPAATISPIYEAIQATALRSFGRPEYDQIDKHLIVVSDLLQHVPGKQSHYAGVPDFETFRSSPYFSEVRANLQGVSVDLYYLHRSKPSPQGVEHARFWEQLLSAQGSKVDSIQRVYGDR